VLTWKDASATGAVAGAIVGQICAMITWIVCSTFERDDDGKHGTVDLVTLGGNYPMLAGNVMAIGMSGIVCAVISMMNPQNFDFNTLKDGIALIDDKLPELDPEENDQAMLDASLKWITKWGVGFTVVMIFIWPLLSLPAGCGDGTCGVFSEGYFTLWVSIALAWGLLATVVIIVLPLYESREVLGGVIKGMFGAKPSDSA
jgi:Na+/proline symporter